MTNLNLHLSLVIDSVWITLYKLFKFTNNFFIGKLRSWLTELLKKLKYTFIYPITEYQTHFKSNRNNSISNVNYLGILGKFFALLCSFKLPQMCNGLYTKSSILIEQVTWQYIFSGKIEILLSESQCSPKQLLSFCCISSLPFFCILYILYNCTYVEFLSIICFFQIKIVLY